jgi:hypothetical protein
MGRSGSRPGHLRTALSTLSDPMTTAPLGASRPHADLGKRVSTGRGSGQAVTPHAGTMSTPGGGATGGLLMGGEDPLVRPCKSATGRMGLISGGEQLLVLKPMTALHLYAVTSSHLGLVMAESEVGLLRGACATATKAR